MKAVLRNNGLAGGSSAFASVGETAPAVTVWDWRVSVLNVASENWDVRASLGRSVSDTAWGVAHPKLTPATLLGPRMQNRILTLPAGSGTPSTEGELRSAA